MAKKKTQGWLDKFDDELQLGGFVYPVNYVPQAENGIEGTMGGLTDQGFNYNGAWGGPSMQMGGAMPGSVGFTYARTQGIPSEGPYAKKTMPSAQNGQEMKFYQEGLDWKPRNISRDGSEISKAQMGTMVTPLDFSKPLGTLEGVSEVMSAPARTATYLLTGKYQDPSQALGIKNPVGAFAADMVLDPVNLLGAGVASKMGKLAGKTTKAVTKTLAPAKKAIQKGIVYSSELHSNPNFIKKLDEGYVQAKKNIDKFSKVKGALANDELWKFSPEELQKYKIQSDLDDEMRIIHGIYPEVPISIQKLNPESILFDGMSKMKLEDFASNKTAGTSWSSGKNRYFNKSDMSKFKNEKEFLKDVGKKEYQEFLNKHSKDYKFSMTDLISLPKNKEGGEITKDDNGYWNPENWGEPVEIGSNEITMQGVYEPLLGISDTGDTQMMYPGEDYKFKGKKVTEYPVAQDGINKQSLINEQLEYIKSPLYTQRLKNMGVQDAEKLASDRANYLKNTEIQVAKPGPISGIGVDSSMTTSGYKEGKEYPIIKLNKNYTEGTLAHEIGHVTTGADVSVPVTRPTQGKYNQFAPIESWKFYNTNKNLKPQLKDVHERYKQNINNITIPYYSPDIVAEKFAARDSSELSYKPDPHDITAGEAYGDLSAIRHFLKKEGITKQYGENITPEMWEKAMKNKKLSNEEHFKRMLKNYDKDSIIYLNNVVAKNEGSTKETYAKNGGWLEKYK